MGSWVKWSGSVWSIKRENNWGKRIRAPFKPPAQQEFRITSTAVPAVAHGNLSANVRRDYVLMCSVRNMIILKLVSENGCWWAWLGHILVFGTIQCVALIRSLQGFFHFQSYYWILSQYTGWMECNVQHLYLGTGNHCTRLSKQKEVSQREYVIQHPSLTWKGRKDKLFTDDELKNSFFICQNVICCAWLLISGRSHLRNS